MPNKVKYNPDGTENAIFKGNWAIDTSPSNTGGGPSSITGFYNGADAPEGGYVIYEEGAVRTIADDTELINYTNSKSGETEITTVAGALEWVADQPNSMAINKEVENIVTDGLVLNLDSGNVSSYPKGGTAWYDLSGNNYNGTLVNGPIYNNGSLTFDNTNDYVSLPNSLGYSTNSVSVFAWYKINGNPTGNYHIICGGQEFEMSINVSHTYLRNGVYTTNGRFVSNNGNVSLNDGNYHYYGFTFDGSTKRAYIDGIQVGTQSVTGTLTTSFNNRRLGRFGSSGTYYANGDLSTYLVWDKVLSAAEVLQNYNATKSRFGL